MTRFFLPLLFLFCFSNISKGGSLTAPFDLESSDTLPKRVGNPRYKRIFMNVENRFNGSGDAEALGAKLNKEIKWKDIIATRASESEKNLLKAALAEDGIAEDRTIGRTTGVVSTYADVQVPVLGFGITEDLTMAVAVPVYKLDIHAQTGFAQTDAGVEDFGKVSARSQDSANTAKALLNNATNNKVVSLGYKPIRDRIINDVGDAKVLAKYKILKDENNTVSIKADVTVPTGTKPDADEVVDVSTGDGQTDIGYAVIYDRNLPEHFKVNTFLGVVHQLPDKLVRRIPQASGESLSPDKENVDRDLGDQISTGLSLNYGAFQETLLLGAGYSYQYMTATKYSGSLYAAERYQWLEQMSPPQSIHSTVFKIGASTVERFKAKKFVYPFQTYLVYSRPVAGTNTNTNDLWAAELVMFF